MGGARGGTIIQAVTVHVIHGHHASPHHAASIACKSFRVISPGLLVAACGRLLPPSVWIQDVHSPIAVDVANADPMAGSVTFFGHVVNDPGTGGIGGIGLGVAHVAFAGIDELRLSVTIDIPQHGDFTLDCLHYGVFVPAPSLFFWIDIELNARAASEHHCDYVGPAVSCEVGSKLHGGIGGKLGGGI